MACLSKSGFSSVPPHCCLNMSWRVASGSEVNPAVQLCVKSRAPKPAHRWHLLIHSPPPPKPPPFPTPRGQKIAETCHKRHLQEQATLSGSVAAALMHADASHDALRRNVKIICFRFDCTGVNVRYITRTSATNRGDLAPTPLGSVLQLDRQTDR